MVSRRQFLKATLATAAAIALRRTSSAQTNVLREHIDDSIRRGVGYLAKHQAMDGAWRSELYGPLKDGPALTALIATALTPIRHRDDCHATWSKAIQYLSDLVATNRHSQESLAEIAYPVYVAAGAVIALSQQSESCDARDRWLDHLRSLQLTEQHGWQHSDLAYGGWSYAATGLAPVNGSAATPLAAPNLSATVYALDALRAAGASTCDPSIQNARHFVERCQNWPADDEQRDARFDDGGFHFILNDAQRNKAGEVGTDSLGRVRFASYGSATADGLRALIACGHSENDSRCRAAFDWLLRNFSAEQHPGGYARDRENLRPSLYYYYCASAARALARSAAASTKLQAMAAALVKLQRQDGSWANSAVDVREDDPLVATALAIQTLVHCQNA